MIALENRPSTIPLNPLSASGSLSSSSQTLAQKKQSPLAPLDGIAIAGAGAVAGAFYGGYLRQIEKNLGESSKVSLLKWTGLGALLAGVLACIHVAFHRPNNETQKSSS
jgi:hypothetical protein